MIKKNRVLLSLLTSFLLVSVFGCGGPADLTGQTSTPLATPTEAFAANLEPQELGPQIVSRSPIQGEQMALKPVITLKFDRPMDANKTGQAWSLVDAKGQPISGEIKWKNNQELEFTPSQKLSPSASYTGILAASAADQQGRSLDTEIRIDYRTEDALTIGQVFPAADTEEVDPASAITVIFNRPVVPLAIKEEQNDLPSPIEISPALPGQGEWVNSSVYVYQPETWMQSGVKYTVRVPASLADPQGNSLGDSYVWQFNTRAPQVLSVNMADTMQNLGETMSDILLNQAFLINFAQPMDSKSVEKALSFVNSEDNRAVPFKTSWNKERTQITITPASRYALSSYYTLSLSTEAADENGGKLSKSVSLKFSTIPHPQVVSTYPKNNSTEEQYGGWASLNFSSPMKEESIKQNLRITPPVDEKNLSIYYGSQNISIYGLAPSTQYIIRVLPGASDIFGNRIGTEYSFTFKTTRRSPYANLVLPWDGLVYRANGGKQEIFFEHLNLEKAEIAIYSITSSQFQTLQGDYEPRLKFSPGSAKPVRSWKPKVGEVENTFARMRLSLDEDGDNPLPPGYYFVGLIADPSPRDLSYNYNQGSVFVVATDSITLKATHTEALAWVVDLENGQPTPNIPVKFYNQAGEIVGSATTDKSGVATTQGKEILYAQLDDPKHTAFANIGWGSGVSAADFGLWEGYYNNYSGPFVYLYTERPLYRPGQDVNFKGILRENDDLHYRLPQEQNVKVVIEHWGERVYEKQISVSKTGTFSDVFSLGSEASLGDYDLSVRSIDESITYGNLTFRVAEYRKPEFEVNITPDQQNVLNGAPVTFDLLAKYYSGGLVNSGSVEWLLNSSPYIFEPSATYNGFSFTDWDRDSYWAPPTQAQGGNLGEGKGVTDAAGSLKIEQKMNLNQAETSQVVTLSANVTDVGGSLVSGSASVIVHQGKFYAGIRSEEYIGEKDKELPFEIVVLDWESKPIAGQKATVEFFERSWYSVKETDKNGTSHWVYSVKEVPAGKEAVTTGEDGKASVSFTPKKGGVFKAVVTVQDDQRHIHRASEYVWVTSDEYIAWRQTNDRSFNLITDKTSYEPGETAEIMLAQPFQGKVYALVTQERGHIYRYEVLPVEGNSTRYKLPITAEMAPMMYLSVMVVNGAQATGLPDFKVGMAMLSVATKQQQLDVSVKPDADSAGPGQEVTYTIETKDANGAPVSAEVSLAVVDKAVLALAPANSGPMLASFYPKQSLGVATASSIVVNADDFNANYKEVQPDGQRSGSGGGKGNGEQGVITVRQNFKDTAFFQAVVTTDENGKATVKVPLPENLTTWQAEVRAVTEDSRVGQAVSELMSTKPLFIQIQAPRFFVNGDQAQIGATVHNTSAEALSVQVSLDAAGVEFQSENAQTIQVSAGGQAVVYWKVTVPAKVKRVDLTAKAVSGDLQDSSKPVLGTLAGQGIPVYTYSVKETVGTSGILDSEGSITESVQLPSSLKLEDASLDVEIAPSLAASMKNGLSYLSDYPYLCLEQTVSRFLPNVVSARALKLAGQPPLTLQKDLDEQVSSALQRIYAKQNYDGGWAWWDSTESDAYTTAYVVYGLQEAQAASYSVDTNALERSQTFLIELPVLDTKEPDWQYNRRAFILYVLARAGKLPEGQANLLFEYRTRLQIYGKAYLAQALHLTNPENPQIKTLMADITGAATLSASGAHWDESSNDFWNWNTGTRTTAIVLNALTQIDPQNPLTANTVRWLMSNRTAGRWESTQETAWSLIALTNWLQVSGELQTNYQYAIGLNGTELQKGSASTTNLTETSKLQISLADLMKKELNRLVFTRNAGPGNLYYSTYLNATLPVSQIQPLDQGMTVLREFFKIDDPKKPIQEIERGELVRVRVTLVLPADAHYVVVNDPLPAGLEAVDLSLQGQAAPPSVYTPDAYFKYGWGWWNFDHIELRDEKVVLSADYLPAGTYVFTYLARASTVGTYQVIPVTAEEFYFPDVAGRGAGSIFVVK